MGSGHNLISKWFFLCCLRASTFFISWLFFSLIGFWIQDKLCLRNKGASFGKRFASRIYETGEKYYEEQQQHQRAPG